MGHIHIHYSLFTQEFGLSPLASATPTCLQCHQAGRANANQGKHLMPHLATGLWLNPIFSFSLEGNYSEFGFVIFHRKVIGARYYRIGYEAEEESDAKMWFRSARDSTGHGSHTASIAAGRYVANMNYKGLGGGGARGGAPMARIAVYKTCWDSGCYDVDLLAAFDDAIRDGVHILSLSLGAESPQGDYFSDAISVGSFHAASRGVLVVASAGNEGTAASATNLAPWILTVAASSTDRDFTSDIILGNGAKIMVNQTCSLLD